MLSMNNKTSFPPRSRKSSAIVSPVRPTLIRAPGGSFICPKTMAVLSITPDSLISVYRSFPSRVRSPTPVNTEYPPCSVAIFRISSWISTVFPTPAPPNRPIFPPFWYGHRRSTTLIPVSRTSVSVDCSENSGAFLWIGKRSAPSGAGLLSIGSPSTLKIRPKVASPTGTEIGPPVACASIPRTNPSVGPIAIHLTVSSPRCCATSTTNFPPSFV